MVANSFVFFVSLMASYFLFFYNAPYWTSKDMADMSSGGIWRAFFRVLSFLGYGLYKLYHFVVVKIIDGILNFIGEKLFHRSGPQSTDDILFKIGRVIDTLFFTGALFLVTYIYNGFMDSFFPEGVSDLAEGGEGFLGKLSRAVVFLRVVNSNANGLGSGPLSSPAGNVAAAIGVTLLALVLYVVINTLYFSILFGFLRQSLDEVDLSKRLTFLKKSEPAPAAEGEKPNMLRQLGTTLLNAFKGFCNKLTFLYYLRDWAVLIMFLVLGLGFSFLMTALGQDNIGPMDVVISVLDSIGVVQLICAFIVTWLANKAVTKAGEGVVKLLPEGMQRAIRKLSDRGNAWADREDNRRRGVDAEPASRTSDLHKMDLQKTDYQEMTREVFDTIRSTARDAAPDLDPNVINSTNITHALEEFEPSLAAELQKADSPEKWYDFMMRNIPAIVTALCKKYQQHR